MKKYKVNLIKFGVEQKTIGFNNYQWTIYHGQIIKESSLTKNFPQYFEEDLGEVEVKEVIVEEVVSPVETVETVEEVVESVVEEVVEEIPAVEEVKTEKTVEEIVAEAKTIKTKTELEAFGLELGIELSKQKSLKYMVNDLEAALKNK